MGLSPSSIRKSARFTTIIFFIVSGIITASWASRIPDVQQSFGLPNAQWGTVLFSVYAGLVCGLPVSSWLISKFGSFKMSFISGVMFATTLLLLPWAPNITVLVVLLFFFGMGRNLMNLSINTKSIEIQNIFSRSIVSSFHGAWSLACLAAAGVGTIMISNNILPRYHFASIAIVGIILLIIFRDSRKLKTKGIPSKALFARPDKYLLFLGGLSFCAMFCEGAVYDWSVNYFDKSVIDGDILVTAGYIAYLICMTLGRLSGDKLIGAFGRGKLLIVNGILMTIGFVGIALFPNFVPAIIAFALVGFGNSIMMPIIYFLAAKSTKITTASAIATVTLLGYGGLLLQPVMMGLLAEALSMRFAFGLLSILGIAVAFTTFRLARNVSGFE